MNSEYNYIEWKLKSTLTSHYQTMSNISFNAKLITEPVDIESNGILVMDYPVNDKIWLSTRTFTSRISIGISNIHAPWVCLSFYRDCMSYYVSELDLLK